MSSGASSPRSSGADVEGDDLLQALSSKASNVTLPLHLHQQQPQQQQPSQQEQFQLQQQASGAPMLLLHQQAEHVLKEAVATLRKENAALVMEIMDLKGDLSMREDQVR
jgi:hypothetical protein